jgi:hypothetical protein
MALSAYRHYKYDYEDRIWYRAMKKNMSKADESYTTTGENDTSDGTLISSEQESMDHEEKESDDHSVNSIYTEGRIHKKLIILKKWL